MKCISWKSSAAILASLLSFYQPVSSKGTLSIQLIDYNNPSHKDYGGSCCDCCGAFGWCPGDCENFFRLLVTQYPYTFQNAQSPWARWETYILGDDSFNFPGYGQTVGSGLKNPLTYHFSGKWPGAFAIRLDVWDDDSRNINGTGHANDHVDTLNYDVVNVPAQKNLQNAVAKSITLTGKRSSTRISVRVYCDADYYGADCNTYCVGRDDSGGHYKCDESTGNKVCLTGWRGTNCLTPSQSDTASLSQSMSTMSLIESATVSPGMSSQSGNGSASDSQTMQTTALTLSASSSVDSGSGQVESDFFSQTQSQTPPLTTTSSSSSQVSSDSDFFSQTQSATRSLTTTSSTSAQVVSESVSIFVSTSRAFSASQSEPPTHSATASLIQNVSVTSSESSSVSPSESPSLSSTLSLSTTSSITATSSEPRAPSRKEKEEAVQFLIPRRNSFEWDFETDKTFKEKMASVTTDYCADNRTRCALKEARQRRPSTFSELYTTDQVQLLPGYPSNASGSLQVAFYVQQPLGLFIGNFSVLPRDTLGDIVTTHKSVLETAIGANISDIEAFFEPTMAPTTSKKAGTVEPSSKDWKWIAIGVSIGVVVIIIIIAIVFWCLKKKAEPPAMKPISDEEEEGITMKHYNCLSSLEHFRNAWD
ncbi:uncharacterized protein LOC144648000, partial [Oculina patagonica]